MADYLINLFVFWLFLISLVPSVYNVDITLSAAERSEVHPASDFSRHTLVKPRIFHGREKRQISTTRDEEKENEHIQHLQISLEVDGEDLVLDLTLNKDLIPQGYFYRYQQNGKDKVHKPTAQEINLCHYNGKVRGKKDSWVALSTCDGLSGVIFDGNELHYIEKETNPKLLNSNLNVPHFLYKHSDLVEHNKTCGYGGDAHEFHNLKDNRILRYKRSTDENELVRGPYNANKESKFVELVLVVDNREYKELGENMNRVKQHCKSIANIINALYAPLNIFIALVGVVVWTEQDAINFSTDGDSTLTNFLHYRRQKLIKEHPNDNAQLLTKNSFDNGVVGKALKGPICTYEYSGGVNTDHSPVVGLVATTVAHEMGHNFGMEHDTNECKCPEDRCIMAPSSSSVAPIHWSSCSLNYLLMAFTRGMDYCLKNKPKALFDSPVCGNGFVEPGEQCDCGLPEHCDNTCCNATTCMLHTNASCATGECCDLTICKPKNAGTMCRSADYECDLPEYCTGQSEYCPTDIYKMDTEECDDGKAYCYHGTCRTRTDQCKLLWGETGHSSDEQCYEMNRKGTRHGNCGYNKFNQSFFKCENDDVLCGMLHCKHLNERLEFGMESVAILSHTFINKGRSIIPCRTAIVDLGINQVDPGLTPDGARCGPDKMCVNQKCMAVASLRKSGPTCPQECNGNGWCNNFGRCHCKDGFAPPFCDYPGHGGSEDSGPASDPNARQGFVSALYIIFLGIIPFLAILFLLFYYGNRNFKLNWKKQPSTTMKGPSSPRSPPFSSDSLKAAEDNHSLLHEDPPGGLQNEFFGQFKGYTLTPLKQEEVNEKEPVRTAPPPPPVISPPPPANYSKPPPPVPAVTRANTIAASKLSFLSKSNSFKIGSLTGGISQANSTSVAPALPPPNPGSSARPIISSPVLENSTCTRKELISPLRNAPKAPFRVAPEIPEEVPIVKQEEVLVKKVPTTNTTLNRITSFLKPDKKPTVVRNNSLNNRPNQIKAQKILDKNALRSIEISNPIPQNENVENVPKPVVMRAQSMRGGKTTPRPAIHTFGSMRQTSGVKRPVSIPSGNRPKSPPPPRPPELDTKPPVEKIKIPSLPGYQKPTKSSTDQYDDCMNKTAPLAQLNEELSPVSSDNIYAVIEDSPQKSEPVKSSSGSSDSMGLLGEIVSEIQNRNFDSIYSTSTLARKKKEEAAAAAAAAIDDKSDTYVNTSSIYKSPESEYCNTNNIKSSASSTSSGYILPSAVNVPETKPTLSSFKNDNTSKPFSSTYTRPLGPLAAASLNNSNIKKLSETFNKPLDPLSNNNKPTEPPTNNKKLPETSNKLDTKKNTKKPQENSTKIKTPPSPTRTSMNRQITPPNLRTRKQSPTNRSITNSPDLVTSCNSNATSKAPDVVNNSTTVKKPSITSAKPNVRTVSKSVSLKTDKKDIKPPIAAKTATKSNSDAAVKRPTAKQSSNVASLQQKFENKTSNGIISTSNKTANKVKV